MLRAYDGERQVTKPSFPLQSCRSRYRAVVHVPNFYSSVAGTRAIEIRYVNDSSGAGTRAIEIRYVNGSYGAGKTALSPGVHRHMAIRIFY